MHRRTCPVCGLSPSSCIIERDFHDDVMASYMAAAYQGNASPEIFRKYAFRVLKCSCGFMWQEEVLSGNELAELYEKWIDPSFTDARNMEKRFIKADHFWAELKFAVLYLKRTPSSLRLIDYGCGFGELLLLSKAAGIDAYALEFSADRIARLEAMGLGTIREGDLHNHKFDIVVVNQVLEHLNDPLSTLISLRECLSENGIACIAVPNGRGVERALRGSRSLSDGHRIARFFKSRQIAPFQHVNYFTNRTLKGLLRRAGFTPFFSPWTEMAAGEFGLRPAVRSFYRYGWGTCLWAHAASHSGG